MPNELTPMMTRLSSGNGSGSICSARLLRTQSKSLRGVVTPAVGRKTRRRKLSAACGRTQFSVKGPMQDV